MSASSKNTELEINMNFMLEKSAELRDDILSSLRDLNDTMEKYDEYQSSNRYFEQSFREFANAKDSDDSIDGIDFQSASLNLFLNSHYTEKFTSHYTVALESIAFNLSMQI